MSPVLRARCVGGFLFAVALARLLGDWRVRAGSLHFPLIDYRWLLAAAVASILLLRGRSSGWRPRTLVALLLALVVAALSLRAYTPSVGHARAPVTASVLRLSKDGSAERGFVTLDSFTLESRQSLHRLSERRREFALEGSFFFWAPGTGSYGFTAACDDYCGLAIDGNQVVTSTGTRSHRAISLEEGVHRGSFYYEQRGGPAYFVLNWDRPSALEILPLEHYVAPRRDLLSRATVERRERRAMFALVAWALWWACALSVFLRVTAERDRVKAFLGRPRVAFRVAAVAAVVLILYGTVLRLVALFAHAQLLPEGSTAARFHEALVPYLPDYPAFYQELQPEDPFRADVAGYLELQSRQTLASFYDASRREPLYVLLVRVFVGLAGGRDVGILIQSFAFSVAALPLAFFVARRLGGPYAATLALAALALNEYVVMEAPSGYRESAYAFFLLAFLASVVASFERPGALRAVVAGLLGASLCLIRLNGLSVVVPLLALASWEARRTRGRRFAVIAFVTLFVGIAPFLWNCYRAYGDPLYSVSVHTQFWLDKEMSEGTVAGSSATRVRLFSYFMDYHSKGALVTRHVRGLTWLPLRTFWRGLVHFPLLDVAVVVAGVVGLLLALRGKLRFVTVAYFTELLPFAYIQNFPSGEMPRFVLPAYFLFLLATCTVSSFVRAPLDIRDRGYPGTFGRR